MLSRLALCLRLAVDDCDRKGGGTRNDIGRLVTMLTGGEDLAFACETAVFASSGLGSAGDGRLRFSGEWLSPGDLISKCQSVVSFKLSVLFTVTGDAAP